MLIVVTIVKVILFLVAGYLGSVILISLMHTSEEVAKNKIVVLDRTGANMLLLTTAAGFLLLKMATSLW